MILKGLKLFLMLVMLLFFASRLYDWTSTENGNKAREGIAELAKNERIRKGMRAVGPAISRVSREAASTLDRVNSAVKKTAGDDGTGVLFFNEGFDAVKEEEDDGSGIEDIITRLQGASDNYRSVLKTEDKEKRDDE